MKPALVLLPGTLCDARIFAHQRRALRDLAHVHALDYRQLRQVADWPAQLLQRLPERFSIAGFSLGGLWALELMRQAPERIERVALIASNARAAGAAARRKSAGLWRLWQRSGPDAVARRVKPAYFHHPRVRREHAPVVRDMARQTGRDAARAEFEWAASRPEGLGALARFGGPVLLVSGAHDRLCPPSWQREMLQAQPAALWLELPRVGHFVPMEAPVRLSAALRHWIQT
jgi:pimeloyl-ACP methyl ester carboxylesterase